MSQMPPSENAGKPRVCGDDPGMMVEAPRPGLVNPACAGMIPGLTTPPGGTPRKPRVCGDDPYAIREAGSPTA